jgi:hypothetical protein
VSPRKLLRAVLVDWKSIMENRLQCHRVISTIGNLVLDSNGRVFVAANVFGFDNANATVIAVTALRFDGTQWIASDAQRASVVWGQCRRAISDTLGRCTREADPLLTFN